MKKISAKELTEDVNNGMTRKALLAKYSISVASLKSLLKTLGLNPKREVKPKVELVMDIDFEEVTSEESVSRLN
jgi:hypothetical protein